MLQGINGIPASQATLQIPNLNILRNELSSTRDDDVADTLIPTKENEGKMIYA